MEHFVESALSSSSAGLTNVADPAWDRGLPTEHARRGIRQHLMHLQRGLHGHTGELCAFHKGGFADLPMLTPST